MKHYLMDGKTNRNRKCNLLWLIRKLLFVDTFYKVMFQNNPLAPIAVPKPEYFDKIDLDKSLNIYKEQFSDANEFNFIFVGSFDIEKIKPLLAMYLGSLPSAGKPSSYVDNGVRRAQGNISFTFKKGTEQKSLIVGVYSGEIAYNDDLALKADALKEVLNIKIIEDLREKLSAIYGGGIYGGLNKLPYNNYAVCASVALRSGEYRQISKSCKRRN